MMMPACSISRRAARSSSVVNCPWMFMGGSPASATDLQATLPESCRGVEGKAAAAAMVRVHARREKLYGGVRKVLKELRRGKKAEQIQRASLRAQEGSAGKRESRRTSRHRRAAPGRQSRDGARSAAGHALARDAGLFRQVPREARLRAERAARLCVRQRQARGVRGLLQR